MAVDEDGSSPRVRGTHVYLLFANPVRRFIPASAGNATCAGQHRRAEKVHPRECGERRGYATGYYPIHGSSPRVRGTRAHQHYRQHRRRFIPASAGNASHHSRSATSNWVHPRECGERLAAPLYADADTGSSPRVRGTRVLHDGGDWEIRFIPASAGNASSSSASSAYSPVHPRECGERFPAQDRRLWRLGSSPRVRGTLVAENIRRLLRRFIPASAGNAPSPACCASTTPVHPRECGERSHQTCTPWERAGSSPRVRGTPLTPRRRPAPPRFIPASAGNAPSAPSRRSAAPVHPRECGERGQHQAGPPRRVGSSPRVRGTPHHLQDHPPARRFIPASAGNALPSRRHPGSDPVHPRECGERGAVDRIARAKTGSSPRVRGTRA